MDKEYIFYTDEGCTISPKGAVLENLQILGIEKGENRDRAFECLIKNNAWICESGFDTHRIRCRQLASS